MNKWSWLLLLIGLYTLFSVVLSDIFHNMLAILGAAVLATLAGLGISLLLKGHRS